MGDQPEAIPISPVEPGADRRPSTGVFLGLVLIGCAVSLSLGVYGRVHTPTGRVITTLGFPDLFAMKVWLTTAAAALGVVQVVTSLRMYGHLGRPSRTPATAITHRASGIAAVTLTLPVALSCLWSLGFDSYSTRVLVHSLAGCVFYGVFVTKMLALRSRRLPGWALPWLGGALFAVLVTLWLTSSLWYFTNGSAAY